ncbi:MAG: aquaporin family protein [Rhizobiaceae bacterium]|nr:aquaporin family protein [Rhizobiaceae bacterium]
MSFAFDIRRRAVAEALGTALLVATIVGSGIMASTLTRDVALALLANTMATAAMLVVLISLLGPISGAHFNPAVSLVMSLRGELTLRDCVAYVAAQFAGGIAGTWAAHLMFARVIFETSNVTRFGSNQWISEAVATFGLLFVILAALRFAQASLALFVGLYIAAAYWFTASTSFANPAVAVARSLTDTFAGIRPVDVPVFIVAELIGALLALMFCAWMFKKRETQKNG